MKRWVGFLAGLALGLGVVMAEENVVPLEEDPVARKESPTSQSDTPEEEAQAGYPFLPYKAVVLGMVRADLEALGENVGFMQITPTRGIAAVKKDDVTMVFVLEDDRVVQINYGWVKQGQRAQRERTQQVLKEFEGRYGKAFQAMEPRVKGQTTVMASVRKFPMSQTETALVESWDGKTLISIANTRRLATEVARLSATTPPLNEAERPKWDCLAELGRK